MTLKWPNASNMLVAKFDESFFLFLGITLKLTYTIQELLMEPKEMTEILLYLYLDRVA